MSRTDARPPFRQREELLDFLLEVSAVASETLNLDELLAAIAQMVQRTISVELLAILLYSDRRKTLRIRYAMGHREEVVRNVEIRLGEGVVGAAAVSRKPVRIGDVRQDSRYLNAVDPVRSEIAVPMMARGRLVGVLDLESTELDAFTGEDQAMLTLIASRVGAAIDNARLHQRLERRNRTLRTLATLAQEFSSILDLDELLKRIAQAVRSLMDFDAFSILLIEGDHLRHRFSQRYDERVEVDNIPLGQGVTGHAASLREPMLVKDTSADPRYISAHPDIRSEVAVPLIIKDRVLGVIDVENEKLGYFTEDHMRTLTLLAPQIAIAIENAQLYEEVESRQREMEDDLQAARRLQRVLLPRRAPAISGLKVAVGARAAREVSGDIYDFLEQSEDYSLVAFGDSSGKGAAAALYGALVSGMLRSLGTDKIGPADMLKELNEVLMERKVAAQYVTLLSILWNASRREMTIANAGAIPPLLIRHGKISQPLVAGVPLGLLAERSYDETVLHLEAGDIVVLYSDGFQDQGDSLGREYGEVRLRDFLPTVSHLPVDEMKDALFTDLDRFRGDIERHDDQTVIVMKVI